jgi:hypothetical protein
MEKTGEALSGEFAESGTHPRRHGKLSKSVLEPPGTTAADKLTNSRSDTAMRSCRITRCCISSWSFPARGWGRQQVDLADSMVTDMVAIDNFLAANFTSICAYLSGADTIRLKPSRRMGKRTTRSDGFSLLEWIRIDRIWLHGGYTKARKQKAQPYELG